MGPAQSWPLVDRTVVDARAAAAQARGALDAGLAQRVRIMARLLGGDWVSGQDLAVELGVSRSAIHKHMESLRSSGAIIVSVRGSGYRLTTPLDSLAPEAVLPLLLHTEGAGGRADTSVVESTFGVPYLYEPATASTNLVLKSGAARGLPGGAVAVTDHQFEGRGRLGRRWVSQAGMDVTASVLLRPDMAPEEASRLVVATAVAVVDVVTELVTEPAAATVGGRAPAEPSVIGIKWPNDVLIDGRKVCGILAEASMDMDRLHWVVLGMGLNVNGRPAALLPEDGLGPGQRPPVSLAEWTGHTMIRGVVLSRLLDRLWRRLAELAQGRWEEIRGAYEAVDALRGTTVSVGRGATGEMVAVGTAAGIGDLGQLLLRQADGTLRPVSAGEVTIVSA